MRTVMSPISILWLALNVMSASAATTAETPATKSPPSERPVSAITVDVGRDNAGGTFGGIGADFGLPNGDLIFAESSSSRVKDKATGKTSSTRTFTLGYSLDPEGSWSLTPRFEHWGAKSDLSTNSFSLEAAINRQDWIFALEPEGKSLVWTSARDANIKRRTGAFGIHAHIDYIGWERWSFQLRGGTTNYGGQRFENFRDSYLITDSAFAQSSGLVKNYGGVSIRYRIGDWSFGVGSQKSDYVVPGTSSVSWTGRIKWRFVPNWVVGYEFSNNKPNDGNATQSHGLSLAFEW